MINAVLDALAPLGVKDFDMPASPHRVWEAMQKGATTPTQQPQTPSVAASTQGRPQP